MTWTTRDYQSWCLAHGIDAGPVDNLWGPRTAQAVREMMRRIGTDQPSGIFPRHGLIRVIPHWTAGLYGDIQMERDAYHFLVMRDGRIVPGTRPPEANRDTANGIYVPHTWRLNSGSIGVAIDAMHGAQESPFRWGPAPITLAQVEGLARCVADLCDTYDIPVSKWTTLTHAEVQPTLGVRQRNKWDITVLPGMVGPGDPVQVGAELRTFYAEELAALRAAA